MSDVRRHVTDDSNDEDEGEARRRRGPAAAMVDPGEGKEGGKVTRCRYERYEDEEEIARRKSKGGGVTGILDIDVKTLQGRAIQHRRTEGLRAGNEADPVQWGVDLHVMEEERGKGVQTHRRLAAESRPKLVSRWRDRGRGSQALELYRRISRSPNKKLIQHIHTGKGAGVGIHRSEFKKGRRTSTVWIVRIIAYLDSVHGNPAFIKQLKDLPNRFFRGYFAQSSPHPPPFRPLVVVGRAGDRVDEAGGTVSGRRKFLQGIYYEDKEQAICWSPAFSSPTSSWSQFMKFKSTANRFCKFIGYHEQVEVFAAQDVHRSDLLSDFNPVITYVSAS
ncbi:hypothetical protein R3P38DRAFT_2788031 [Favolaschia claudopus]|uniref:Uncharacterized protein n=1 Tax=Favolaschia claudopus TaxID=2862362 RepID=A0AAW0ANU4_9AGAR